MQEAGFSAYPTFTELHQIIYRTEMNLYENFHLPQGVTRGGDDTHVNDQAVSLFKRLLGRPARLIVEVHSRVCRRFWSHLLLQAWGVLEVESHMP